MVLVNQNGSPMQSQADLLAMNCSLMHTQIANSLQKLEDFRKWGNNLQEEMNKTTESLTETQEIVAQLQNEEKNLQNDSDTLKQSVAKNRKILEELENENLILLKKIKQLEEDRKRKAEAYERKCIESPLSSYKDLKFLAFIEQKQIKMLTPIDFGNTVLNISDKSEVIVNMHVLSTLGNFNGTISKLTILDAEETNTFVHIIDHLEVKKLTLYTNVQRVSYYLERLAYCGIKKLAIHHLNRLPAGKEQPRIKLFENLVLPNFAVSHLTEFENLNKQCVVEDSVMRLLDANKKYVSQMNTIEKEVIEDLRNKRVQVFNEITRELAKVLTSRPSQTP